MKKLFAFHENYLHVPVRYLRGGPGYELKLGCVRTRMNVHPLVKGAVERGIVVNSINRLRGEVKNVVAIRLLEMITQ